MAVIRAVVARTLTVLLVAAAWSPRPVRADAVVGTSTAGGCTEAALDAALAAGGNITFNCGASPVTTTVTSEKSTTSIDGGGVITISGGGTTRVMMVNDGTALALVNLTISAGFCGSAAGGSAIGTFSASTTPGAALVSAPGRRPNGHAPTHSTT